MATGGGQEQEQDNTKKSLGYYLHWVLAREVNSKSSQNRSSREDRSAKNKAEQRLIAIALSKVVFQHIVSSEETANRYLEGLKRVQKEEDFITETGHNEYDIKIWLKSPVPRGSLEVMTGSGSGMSPGEAKLTISRAMTNEERFHVRSQWAPFMDGDNCLSPGKIHQWLHHVVNFGFTTLDDKVFRKHKLALVKVTGEYPDLRVILSCNPEDDDDHEVFSIIYHIIPALRAYGFPRGACLQHPFPKQMPYSKEGQEILKELQRQIDDGDVCFTLETPPRETGGVGAKPMAPPALTRRAAVAAEEREESDRRSREQIWQLSLGTVETLLLERALLRTSMKHARTAIDVFSALQQSKGGRWKAVSPAVTNAAMLWTIKKTSQKNRNASDWFVAYLQTLQKFMARRFCPQFLQMNINVMVAADTEEVDAANADLVELLQDIAENPTNLLKHYLQKH